MGTALVIKISRSEKLNLPEATEYKRHTTVADPMLKSAALLESWNLPEPPECLG
jgi:hypothetical protein